MSELNNVRDSFDSLLIDPSSESDFQGSGILGFNVIPPEGTEKITLSAQYSDKNGDTAETKQVIHKFSSDDGKYLSIWTLTENALVGEYAIFHVKVNFWTPSFQYLVSELFHICNKMFILFLSIVSSQFKHVKDLLLIFLRP